MANEIFEDGDADNEIEDEVEAEVADIDSELENIETEITEIDEQLTSKRQLEKRRQELEDQRANIPLTDANADAALSGLLSGQRKSRKSGGPADLLDYYTED